MEQVTEDPRKTAVKNGLRQLTAGQIRRVLSYRDPMIHDQFNYADGMYCPLAVGCGLPGVMKDPTNDKVVQVLTLMGYKVNNTKGVEGTFYRDNRAADLREAALEVLVEKEEKA